MQARLAVLADAANVAADGKLNILGEFNLIRASMLPAIWGRMFLVVKLEAEAGEGSVHSIRIRVLDEDSNEAADRIEGEIGLGRRYSPGIPLGSHFIIEIRNACFTKYGHYEFEVSVGDSAVAHIPLYVLPLEQGGPAPSQP